MGQRWPNCDADVAAWVSGTVKSLCGELVADFVGAYLHGSLAAGSFYRPKSDVDLLFVVRGPLPSAARRVFAETCVHTSRGPTHRRRAGVFGDPSRGRCAQTCGYSDLQIES